MERHSKISHDIKKKGLNFYRHVMRLPDDRVTKIIMLLVNGQKIGWNWIKNVQKDLFEVEITDDIILCRTKFRKGIERWENHPVEIKGKNVIFSQESKETTSATMNKFWVNRRNKNFAKPPKKIFSDFRARDFEANNNNNKSILDEF